MTAPISPLFFERYELKYHIPYYLVDQVSDFVSIYCDLDPFSQNSPDGHYEINNLYLDSPNLIFYQNRLADVNERFNMRVRSYGNDPKPPYFLEVKYKNRGLCSKTRAVVHEEDWFEMFDAGFDQEHNEPKIYDPSDFKMSFFRLAHAYNVSPQVFTQYRRKAYASNVDEYARVTFDKDLTYMRPRGYSLKPDQHEVSHYDHIMNFEDGTDTILELKCDMQVPTWFLDLIKTFQLKHSSFSKYVSGVEEVIPDFYAHKIDRVPNFKHFQVV